MASRFKTAVLGGTFDHFHKGHKSLINKGLSISEKLIIGITSDKYINNSKSKTEKPELFEDFKTRRKNVEGYLNEEAFDRFEIVEIENMFGPTLDKNFNSQAIVVSYDTKKGAEKINHKRQKLGLKKFEIIETEEILAEDRTPISSFRIRNGQFNRDGELFIKPEWFKEDLIITPEIRKKLKDPWGNLYKSFEPKELKNNQMVISVGDETTKILNQNNIPLGISVVDFKVARERKFSDVRDLGFSENIILRKVANPPGTLSAEIFLAIREAFDSGKNPQVILVDGEDDLAVLPLILEAPLGTNIFYGQPGEGLVRIEVNEKIKAEIFQIVAKFTPHHL